jgi:hypothetical protein
MERLLDCVGLAIALIELKKNGKPRLNDRHLGRPGEAETCLT